MEARFIILHPDDPGEILLATALIRCLKTQVEESYVYSVVKEKYRWILDSNPYLDEIFAYRENPLELLEQLKDFLPDYLIDLDGSRANRRFKNRLKVLDFTINRKDIGGRWQSHAFDTCTLFDVNDDGKGTQLETSLAYEAILPTDFLDGYVVLSLDTPQKSRILTDIQIVEIAVVTEKPIVITGSAIDRNLADRIGQSTGCAVFPTCGDLTSEQTASVMSHALGIIAFDPFWCQAASAIGVKSMDISEKIGTDTPKEIALWARSLFHQNNDRNSI